MTITLSGNTLLVILNKLTDQHILNHLAKNDGYSDTRLKAAIKLTDKNLAKAICEDIARYGMNNGIRKEACEISGHQFDSRCKCTRCEHALHDWDNEIVDVTCMRCGGTRRFMPSSDDETSVEIIYPDGKIEYAGEWLTSRWFQSWNRK